MPPRLLGHHRDHRTDAAVTPSLRPTKLPFPMEPVQVEEIEQLKELIGQELGPTEWVEITQEDIDRFADVSRDHQWIHTDPERAAKESPYGTTVAHGNLTLSLVDSFRPQLIQNRGVKMGINYGFDKVRFPAAVPAGTRSESPRRAPHGRRARRRLVARGHQVRDRGRGPGEARLRGRERRPSADRLRAAPRSTVSVPSMPPARWPSTLQ